MINELDIVALTRAFPEEKLEAKDDPTRFGDAFEGF